jgi:archaellum component FlaG (FlaF/FlaG flagellin family)
VNPFLATLVVTAAVFRACSYVTAVVSNELNKLASTYRVEVSQDVLERMWNR